MRKAYLRIMLVFIVLSLVGCGKSETVSNNNENVEASISSETVSNNNESVEASTSSETESIGKKEDDKVYIDYADAESFEAALNAGENLEGKIVQFEALELHPQSAYGYNVWAGEHLNFISSRNPDIKAGEMVIVKANVIESSLGSWFITYEKVDDAIIGEDTISSKVSSSGTSTFAVNDAGVEKQPLELTDYGFYMEDSQGDKAYIKFCGMIYNPNEKLIAEFPKIIVTVKNADGTILATEEQMGSIVMPGDTITLCGMLSVLTTNISADTSIIYEVECNDLVNSTSMYSQARTTDFEISNVSEINGSENYITGQIMNNYFEDIDSVNISIVLRKNGEIVFVDNTFLANIKSGQAKAFEFQRYSAWPEHDTIDVSALVW